MPSSRGGGVFNGVALLVFIVFMHAYTTIADKDQSTWRCTGCTGDQELSQIRRRVVQTAARGDVRLAYLPLDTSWMDDLTTQPVHLVLDTFTLGTFERVHASHSQTRDNMNNAQHRVDLENEEIQLVAYVVTEASFAPATTAAVRRRRYEAVIDRVLALHPCWVPVQEPSLFTNLPPGTPSKQHGRALRSGDGAWDALAAGNNSSNSTPRRGGGGGGGSGSGSGARQRARRALLDPSQLLVLAHLPAYGFGPTCRLFRALVRRQFPPTCAYTAMAMASFPVGNIGWAHVLNFLTNALAYTMGDGVGLQPLI